MKRTKRWIPILLLTLLALCPFAVSAQGARADDIALQWAEEQKTFMQSGDASDAIVIPITSEDVQLPSGGFGLLGLPWRSSPAQAEAIVGTLVPMHSPSDVTGTTGETHTFLNYSTPFTAYTLYALEGQTGWAQYQFMDDELVSVDISFKTNMPGMEENDLDALYTILREKLVALYGEPQQTQAPSAGTKDESISWDAKDDALEAGHTRLAVTNYLQDEKAVGLTITLAHLGWANADE